MIGARLSRAASWLPPLLSLLAAGLAYAPATMALSVIDHTHLDVRQIPLDVIQLDPCPPRCSASAYARLHPSVVYKPVEPDDIIFDGETSLIWGTSAGSEWLLWGGARGPFVTVWDESMWVEDIDTRVAAAPDKSKYRISQGMNIPDVRPKRTRGAAAGSRSSEQLQDGEAPQLGGLDEVPPESLTPIDHGWLATVLGQLSKSQYAVGAVTLGLMALMARLLR